MMQLLTSSYQLMSGFEPIVPLLQYRLIKTEHRLTFDILYQADHTKWQGDDDGEYYMFTASNGYQVISRSRMDIQTERIWLLGASDEVRSGTMVFRSNEKRDQAFDCFQLALAEWSQMWAPEGNSNVGKFYCPELGSTR